MIEMGDQGAAGISPRVSGWRPCQEALADDELVSDPRPDRDHSDPSNSLLFMDGELHRRLRTLVMPFLAAHRLQRLHGGLADCCRSLVGSAFEDPAADLVSGLAEPLVLEAVFSAMEVPLASRARLGALAREMLGLLEPDLPPAERRRATNAAVRAAMVFRQDREAGRQTGLHAALETAGEEGSIPPKLARSTPVVVLHGGYENPLNQLGCVIALAVQDPEWFKRAAAASPVLLFEEIVRVYSPVCLLARWVRGQLVWIDLESANHDRRRFASADRIEPSPRRRHLGFGYGAHACPGTSLARLEGRVLIEALATVPTETLRTFAVEWRKGVVARGPARIVRDGQRCR